MTLLVSGKELKWCWDGFDPGCVGLLLKANEEVLGRAVDARTYTMLRELGSSSVREGM